MANTAWWEQFGDPVLNDLISLPSRKQRHIDCCGENRGVHGKGTGQHGRNLSQVEGAATVSRTEVSDRINEYLPAQYDNPYNDHQVIGNASWEIDLWGKNQNGQMRRLRANLLSTEENRRTVIMSLVSAIAAAYIDLRDLDRELEIAELL